MIGREYRNRQKKEGIAMAGGYAMRLRPEANEYRKRLSGAMMALRLKEHNGTASEYDLEQLYVLTGEYKTLMDDPGSYMPE